MGSITSPLTRDVRKRESLLPICRRDSFLFLTYIADKLLRRIVIASSSSLYRRQEVDIVQARVLEFLKKLSNKGQCPMCGNSICQDRRFLARLMPRLEAHFNYRNLDVTSIKIASQLWAPDIARSFSKTSKHLARDDIFDSIYELQHYKNHLLNID